MSLVLFNTLKGEKEPFEPINKGLVKMYHCGPTVYNYAHIGNLRPYIFTDVLRRFLEYSDYSVNQVINITDVGHLTSDADSGEDKVEKRAEKEGKTAKEITDFYAEAFLNDLSLLNINTSQTKFPKATDYIEEQIALIKDLEEKGFTYGISDGIYFDTSKFSQYGKLGGIDLKGLKEGARVEKNPEKRNPTDFALWKFSSEQKRQQEWDSPWGVGFPGWHIECSAMSMKLLGETFDIHTGGIDHIPVHHNNEIAQSEASTGKPLANFWLHSAFLNIDEGKMAKSSENFIRLNTILDWGFSPMSFRLFLLNAHYRTQISFSKEVLISSENSLKNLVKDISSLGEVEGSVSAEYLSRFSQAMDDDLNTPKALSVLHELIKDYSIKKEDKLSTILNFDQVLGLNLKKLSQDLNKSFLEIPIPVKNLAEERESARKAGNFKRADELRAEITSLGFNIEDTPEGPRLFFL